MKTRLLAVAVLSCISVGSLALPGAAGEGRSMPRNAAKRTSYAAYNYVAGSSDEGVTYNVYTPVVFDVGARERWATITIHDDSGLPVPAELGQDHDGDGIAEETRSICGTTGKPMNIMPRHDLVVTVQPGPCTDQGGVATAGYIQADLFSPSSGKPAPPRVERVEELTYTGPDYYETGDGGFSLGSHRIDTYSEERYVTLDTTDASGYPTHVIVYIDNGPAVEVCGETTKAIEFPAGGDLFVEVDPSPCSDGTPAAATTGTLEVVLANVP
ncbi:MAG: hypothetical protein ACRDKT_09775 [Actinomycetota bacterium]